MKILAIDAGFSRFGWAWFHWEAGKFDLNSAGWHEYSGADDRKKALRASDALVEQSQWLYRTYMSMLPSAHALIVELPSGGAKSATAMRAMGMASAVIGCAAAQQGLPVEWVPPNDVKRAMTGHLSASKDDIVRKAFELYPAFKGMVAWRKGKKGDLQPDSRTEHPADAIGAFEAAKNGQLVLSITTMIRQAGNARTTPSLF